MPKMRTSTRMVYNPHTGKRTPTVVKYHACSAKVNFGRNVGKPCSAIAIYEVGGKWWCGFHHPDKAKRQTSGFQLARERTGRNPNGSPLSEEQLKKTPRVRRKAIIPAASPAEAIADGFATSFAALIDAQVKRTLRDMFSPKED